MLFDTIDNLCIHTSPHRNKFKNGIYDKPIYYTSIANLKAIRSTLKTVHFAYNETNARNYHNQVINDVKVGKYNYLSEPK